ncbi:mixed lineage kinase domain-like protein [Lates calcarifer]|uniref:Mixed lineage kinase domain-like protein n=1 Tax=Lates calcarifer TaxID=8187 RepID=A0AAJ8BAG5_LATCA|nr:mixed lineage kinase domain-like protein [Lates calcarifer]
MDFIEPILSVASEIYALVEKVKANRKRCHRVSDRVKALEELVRSIRQREMFQSSDELEKSLKELSITLKSAEQLIKKYTLANWVERILNSSSHEDEFKSMNERLSDAFQVLSGALQVEQGNMLSWTKKACMCLDAAQGLYRSSQGTEVSACWDCFQPIECWYLGVGRTINKVLMFFSQLGGLELVETEMSLKKSTNHKETRSLCYSSPQMLSDISHYSKECEMYSFGIVMWEVATRKRPFEGCSGEEIYKKVYEERYQEPLPDDCPEPLGHLINACRAYDNFQRPSAGVLVDKLRTLVAQLEER